MVKVVMRANATYHILDDRNMFWTKSLVLTFWLQHGLSARKLTHDTCLAREPKPPIFLEKNKSPAVFQLAWRRFYTREFSLIKNILPQKKTKPQTDSITGNYSCRYHICFSTYTCVAVPTKKKKMLNLCSNRQLEPPLPLNFFYRIFRHSALAPNFYHWSNISQGRYELLGALPWVWRSDSSFRDLPSTSCRRNWKMRFQALEFAVSRTVAKYIFYCCCRRFLVL